MEPHILETLEARIVPDHTALLIIDMQKDFVLDGLACDRAGRDLTATRSIIPALGRLLAAARHVGTLVVHVGFWTLDDHASDSGPWLAQRRRATFSSDRVCMADTVGAEFIDELSPRPGELVVHKHRYSAFKGTDLELLLRGHGIKTVITTGVSTNACVESTAREAFELGNYLCVPSDGVASWDNRLHQATLETINHRFGLVPTVDEIMDIWQAARPQTATG